MTTGADGVPGFDFDVIQVGYGPVSKASALFLERKGWRVGVFERFAEVYPLPRAVCIDHELVRVLHAAGLGAIADRVCSPAPTYRWYNADWQQLLEIDWAAGSVSGGPEVTFIHQPTFEAEMDRLVKARPGIALHFESEVVGVSQDGEGASVQVRDGTGSVREVRARYVIGIDGANSAVRQALDIPRTDLGFEADWLVIDFALAGGLTARDLGIPDCGQFCNPLRPTTIVPGGIDAQGRVCRRWEFMRLPHETREEMNQESKVWELLSAWIKPDQGTLVRHSVYTFRSLVAERFQEGRVFLAGDAAHVMPPFMGQGMCAGLRDVWNLAWKLDRVLRDEAAPALLDTYTPERAPHVTDIIKASIFLGSIICMPDPAEAAARDRMFLGGEAPRPAPFPILTGGLLERDAAGEVVAPAGELSPHGAVRLGGRTGRLDAALPPGFNMIVAAGDGEATLSDEVRLILAGQGVPVAVVADRREAHDHQIGDTQGQILPFMTRHGAVAMLVRPDFYLYGAAADADRLETLVRRFAADAARLGLQARAPVAAAA